ncbi:MAG: type III-B CRISPR module-associated protein Cmr5 [Methylococcaceae bacterium]
MKTRAQKYSQQAYEHISQLNFDDDKQKKLYGSICHDFPIMVLRAGLAQSVAFLWIKAESGKPAYEQFLHHLSSITGHETESYCDFQQRIQQMELDEYRRTTRTILNAGIWYKRFAESLLNVKVGEGNEHG